MVGSIIFYNLDDGSGLILSENKNKYKFDVGMWEDIDNMPSVGLKVSFDADDEGNISNLQKFVEEIKLNENLTTQTPRSVEEAARIILQGDSLEEFDENGKPKKLEGEVYSAKTVPSGLIEASMNKFFSSLHDTVDKYKDYQLQNDEESLDYLRMKRFLFTAYNNILEIDSSLADGSLMEMYKNIQEVNSIHDIYKKSFMYPKIAFSTIFLKYTRYKEAKARLQRNINEMGKIKSDLSILESDIKYSVEKIGQLQKDDESIKELRKNIKYLKSHYVDAIDRLGTLREENEILIPITNEYFELFFEEFSQKFQSSYQENIRSLVDVLDSMAFLFDRLMWEKASSSNIIQRYFKEAGITYPYSSLTYLRYYLKTLNKAKLTKENKELFDLLEYLENKK